MTVALQDHHRQPRWYRAVFTTAAVAALTLIGLNGLLLLQPDLFDGILNDNTVSAAAAHFSTLDHRIHDVIFGLLYGVGAVGLLAQLRSPRTHIAAQLMALTPFAALGVTFALTNYWIPFGTNFQMYATAIYGGLTLTTLLLHPAGPDLFTAIRRPQPCRPLLVLTGIAALPLLVLATDNITRQRTETPSDIHWQLGHYGFVAALALTITSLAVLSSLQPDGWRLTAWTTSALTATLGTLSLLYPDVDSSLHPAWAISAIIWSVAFIATAESANRSTPTSNPPDRIPSLMPTNVKTS